MEAPDKKELIEEITALFKEYEEPYEAGSWEDFSKRQKKRRLITPLWIGIAASLLVILSVLPFVWKKNDTAQPIMSAKNKVQQPSLKNDDKYHPGYADNGEITGQEGPVLAGITTRHSSSQYSATGSGVGIKRSFPEVIIKDTTPATSFATVKTSDSSINNKEALTAKVSDIKRNNKMQVEGEDKKKDFVEFLKEESARSTAKTTRTVKRSKWGFGVEVSPTLLQSRLNMGAGVTTEYKLSNNFSLSSGIGYIAMAAGKSLSPDPAAPSTMSSKRLLAVSSDIRAIDIPISVTYNVNKQLYASVGVSYFGVLSEKRGNKYLTEMEVSNTVQNIATGDIESYKSVLSEKNTEVTTEPPLNGNSYLGFFNLSVGHKQQIFNKYNIVVEPFLKIPVGKLSNQDLKLTNGGMRLKFTF